MLSCLAVTMLGSGCPGESSSSKDPKPYNFVIVMADDLGAGELASYGHPTHVTPNLDRLAREGMRFRTAYATPICSASRVMIMTGRYGFRTGWFNQLLMPYSPLPTSPAYHVGAHELTFADLLRNHGYATALAGKWQLPGSPEERVRDCGFDEYCIWMWKHDLPAGEHPGETLHRDHANRTSRSWHPGVIENARYRRTEENDYGPDIFTQFIVEFIRRNRDRPFVAYYPMTLTHDPWDPTPIPGSPGERSRPDLASNIAYMDHIVGRIVQAVDQAGLRERTIIIFTSDNGTARGGKGFATERGARVPLIVRAPGTVAAGRVSEALVDFTDILPTLVEFAGARLPDDRPIDGVSLAPILRGDADRGREWIFSYLGNQRILRDRRWLLEGNTSQRFGTLHDCGERGDPADCRVVEDLEAPLAAETVRRFAAILEALPGPERFPDLVKP